MELNADFSRHVVIRPDDYVWRSSPALGVDRMMLDRLGDEVARATTIVRFAPNSTFDRHEHGGGEEFLVLAGVFSDEHADYPAGTYVRNPIGTAHTPHIGAQGATILVKLCQFAASDTEHKVLDTRNLSLEPSGNGLETAELHNVPGERVRLVKFAPGTKLPQYTHVGGTEIFVLEGMLSDENGHYPTGTWLRFPDGAVHSAYSDDGCVLWVKTGHLAQIICATPTGS